MAAVRAVSRWPSSWSHQRINFSTFATMRCCSARGGMGIRTVSRMATLMFFCAVEGANDAIRLGDIAGLDQRVFASGVKNRIIAWAML